MEVEWLILCDAAQVVGGKLYLLGGGWDVLNVAGAFPTQQRLTIAAAFNVPWTETNRRHEVLIEIADEDGAGLGTIQGQVELGRPPGLPEGSDQRAQLSAEVAVTFARPATFSIIARVNGQEGKRLSFRVVPAPAPA